MRIQTKKCTRNTKAWVYICLIKSLKNVALATGVYVLGLIVVCIFNNATLLESFYSLGGLALYFFWIGIQVVVAVKNTVEEYQKIKVDPHGS